MSPSESNVQLQTKIKTLAGWAWRHTIDWLPATLRPSFIHLFVVGSFLNAIQVILISKVLPWLPSSMLYDKRRCEKNVKIIPQTSFVTWLPRLSSNEGSAGAFSHSLCSTDVSNDSLPITMGSVKLAWPLTRRLAGEIGLCGLISADSSPGPSGWPRKRETIRLDWSD